MDETYIMNHIKEACCYVSHNLGRISVYASKSDKKKTNKTVN